MHNERDKPLFASLIDTLIVSILGHGLNNRDKIRAALPRFFDVFDEILMKLDGIR